MESEMTKPSTGPNPTGPNPPREPGAIEPVPTRISDLAPLIVEREGGPAKERIADSLEDLEARMADMHAIAAEGWISQGEYDKALPHLNTCVTFAPRDTTFLGRLGFVRYVTGDDQGAAESYQAIVDIDADNADAWFSLGMIAFGRADHAAAETCFRRSARIAGGDPQTWNNLGVCLFRQDRVEDARVCFQKALELDPNDEDAEFNLDNLDDLDNIG